MRLQGDAEPAAQEVRGRREASELGERVGRLVVGARLHVVAAQPVELLRPQVALHRVEPGITDPLFPFAPFGLATGVVIGTDSPSWWLISVRNINKGKNPSTVGNYEGRK